MAKPKTQTYNLLSGQHRTRTKEGVLSIHKAGDQIELTEEQAKRMGARVSGPVLGQPGQYAAEVQQVSTASSTGDADEGKVETGPPTSKSTGEAFGLATVPAQQPVPQTDAQANAKATAATSAAKATAAGKKG